MSERPENLVLLIHQTHDALNSCEDKMFSKHGFTTEQFSMLVAVKSLNSNARVTDVSRLLGRSVNSISMMADRMAKAGLLKRVRDKKDRRQVHLTITATSNDRLGPAVLAFQTFVGDMLTVLSSEDEQIFAQLLDKVKQEASKHLDPVS